VAAGLVILVFIAVGGALVAVDRGAKATKDQTFAVSGAPRLLVASDVGGSIQVHPGSDNAVRVQAQLRGANRIDFNISQSGDTVDVAAHRSGWLNWLGGARKADIVVSIPRRSLVELDSANSRIDLQGVEGAATLHTSNADLHLANVIGPIDASSSNGSIQADGVQGTVKLHTSNGSIKLTGITGSVDAQTSNGSITFSGTPAAQSNNRLKTSNGSVNVFLPVASASNWWPRQTPSTGTRPTSSSTVLISWCSGAGSPGPLPRSTPP